MILVRHAESEWNHHFSRSRIDPGIRDPALTEIGRRQAERLIPELALAGVARLIVSPYRRALETAAIVARAQGLEITIEPLVRERCVYSCDLGTPRSRLALLWPQLAFDHLQEQWWGEPDESLASIGRRAAAFHARCADLPDRASVAVITHWGFIRALSGAEVANAACIPLPANAALRMDGLRSSQEI